MEIEIINVDNGNSDYPGSFTKKEIEIIENNIFGYCVHLFSGKSKIGNVRVDFDCPEATLNDDVFAFLERNNYGNVDTVILDPPYNEKFGLKYQKLIKEESEFKKEEQFLIFANARKTTILFNLIRENLNPKILIIKSWNYYVPKGYELKKGYLCYAGGYRKPTILEILKRSD